MIDTLKAIAPQLTPRILDNISDALLVLSLQGGIVGSNASGRNILASTHNSTRKLAEYLDTELSLAEVYAKNDVTPIQQRKIVLSEKTYTVRAALNDDHLVLILSDVSDLKRMAQDLSANFVQLLRFKQTLHSLSEALVITDAFEHILFMNAAMQTLLASKNSPSTQTCLADLEAVFGHLPSNENPVCIIEEYSHGATGDPRLGHMLIEKQPLLLNREKLHGFLLRFSQQPGSTQDSQEYRASTEHASPPILQSFTPEVARQPRKKKPGSYSLTDFVGQSKAILHIKNIIKKVAPSSSTVLLQSESGTGKELLARALHELSGRANGPFIKLNCASLPESLLEAEVFGYDSGAFTGAKKSGNPGLFEQAHTGTIFLDELGEMSLSLQAKLLRIIQEREVQRLGGQGLKRLDVRVVCATNCNLLRLVEQGKFRSDLLFRLNVVSIAIPPLRSRKEDIKSLIIHFLRDYSLHFKKNVRGISKEVYYLFMNYDWPGNVRELGNILEYAFNIIDGNIIKREHLPQYIFDAPHISGYVPESLDNRVAEYSCQVIMGTLEQYGGNKAAAASALGISRSKLYRLMAEAGWKKRTP